MKIPSDICDRNLNNIFAWPKQKHNCLPQKVFKIQRCTVRSESLLVSKDSDRTVHPISVFPGRTFSKVESPVIRLIPITNRETWIFFDKRVFLNDNLLLETTQFEILSPVTQMIRYLLKVCSLVDKGITTSIFSFRHDRHINTLNSKIGSENLCNVKMEIPGTESISQEKRFLAPYCFLSEL